MILRRDINGIKTVKNEKAFDGSLHKEYQWAKKRNKLFGKLTDSTVMNA